MPRGGGRRTRTAEAVDGADGHEPHRRSPRLPSTDGRRPASRTALDAPDGVRFDPVGTAASVSLTPRASIGAVRLVLPSRSTSRTTTGVPWCTRSCAPAAGRRRSPSATSSRSTAQAGEPGDPWPLPALLLVDGDAVTTDAEALAKVTVTAEVVATTKGPKIDILKYKNKTGYRKRQGHRQELTHGQGHRHRRPEEVGLHGTQEGRIHHPQRSRLQRPAPRREALRRPGSSTPARSSSASAAPTSTPAPTSAAAATTRCSRWPPGTVEFGTRRGRRVVNIVAGE